VLGPKRLTQERVVLQVDLADDEVVRGVPVCLHQRELPLRERRRHHVIDYTSSAIRARGCG
jgi:hypothetical protein